jgi:hypothetical protein
VRAGLAAGVVISTALAADTISITIIEVIDNLTVAVWPARSTPVSATRSRTSPSRSSL